jgi:hypothetical protein
MAALLALAAIAAPASAAYRCSVDGEVRPSCCCPSPPPAPALRAACCEIRTSHDVGTPALPEATGTAPLAHALAPAAVATLQATSAPPRPRPRSLHTGPPLRLLTHSFLL